jgi:hypothetical protein
MQETIVGETLPLFELPLSGQRIATGKAPNSVRSINLSDRTRSGVHNNARLPTSQGVATLGASDGDCHMHVAWQLSQALKAVKTGRKAGRDMAKLTANQRHQVGNAICEHLLASLRQQVHSESSTTQ